MVVVLYVCIMLLETVFSGIFDRISERFECEFMFGNKKEWKRNFSSDVMLNSSYLCSN